MRCTIWNHLYNLKEREKHPWRSVTFSKINTDGCFSRFLNCTDDTKSRKASHMRPPRSLHLVL